MVASRQIEISYSRRIGRQHEWGLSALVQLIATTAIPFLVPPANCVGADLMEFAAPEITEVVSG